MFGFERQFCALKICGLRIIERDCLKCPFLSSDPRCSAGGDFDGAQGHGVAGVPGELCNAAFLEQTEQQVPQDFLPAEANPITVTGQLAGWLTPSCLMALLNSVPTKGKEAKLKPRSSGASSYCVNFSALACLFQEAA